jgi:hypothetical protein
MNSSLAISPETLDGSTAAQKRSCWPSASRSNTNSQARRVRVPVVLPGATAAGLPGRSRRERSGGTVGGDDRP